MPHYEVAFIQHVTADSREEAARLVFEGLSLDHVEVTEIDDYGYAVEQPRYAADLHLNPTA